MNLLQIAAMAALCSCGPTVVRMSDYGLMPSGDECAVEKIRSAFDYAAGLEGPVILQFEKGTYDLGSIADRNAGETGTDNYLFNMNGCREITIDGGGSEFVFNGIAGLALIRDCKDVTLRNFSIDWKRPYITQAEIRGFGEDWMEIAIDRSQYPYRIDGGKVRYICGDGEYGVVKGAFCNFYTPQGDILPGSFDNYWMGELLNGEAEEVSDGVLRFHGPILATAPAGSLLTIHNVSYRTSWATVVGCDGVTLKDITVYHTVGCGVVSTVSGNITIDNVDYVPRKEKGRVFSGADDAFHLTNNFGRITITGCDVNGQGDDALNVHGRYCQVMGVSADGRTLKFSATHGFLLFHKGEKAWLVEDSTMQRSREYTIVDARKVGMSVFELTLDDAPQMKKGVRYFLESASCCPELLVENNRFGRGNRARGILVTTPGKAVVRNNVFESSGAAVLIEGDLTYWYESGGVRDLTITGNVFDRCHTSQWGAAVICISPSPVPEDDSLPRYHKGIRITDNEFRMAGEHVLYARNVDSLVFRGNHISGLKGEDTAGAIVLEHCTNTDVLFK